MVKFVQKNICKLLWVGGMLFVGLSIMSGSAMAESNLSEEDMQNYSQNNIVFYEPCGQTSTEICGTNENYAGQKVWSEEQMQALQANSPYYQKAAELYDIPWQVIAVIHMREHGLARSNPDNGQGIYQFRSATTRANCAGGDFTPGAVPDAQFQIQTNCAAKFIKEVYGAGLDLKTDDGVKKLFYHYNSGNGGSSAYEKQAIDLGFSQEEAENGEGSPYVMNRYDEKREPSETWGQIKEDEGPIEYPANSDFGAFVYYKAITCGEGGGSDTDKPACNSCEQGSKNINGAAACLAWPLGTESGKYNWPDGKASPAFENAINTLYPDYHTSDKCALLGASCDVFTGVAVRWSGYDDNFPRWVGKAPTQQTGYARQHPELWEVIEWDGEDKTKVQAGDIINAFGNGGAHSYAIVQDESGELYIAEAGHCNSFGHISEYHKSHRRSEVYIIRAKSANNSSAGVSVANGVSSSSINGFISSSGKGNGDINASAIELAWPEGEGNPRVKATDKFEKVFADLSGGPGSGCWKNGKSCSVFVNTVLLYAGAQKGNKVKCPGCIADDMIESEDWEEVGQENLKHSDLQPGDVIVYYRHGANPGNESKYNYKGLHVTHIAIYVETAKGGRIAEASFCNNFGKINKINANGSVARGYAGARVFRWKKNKSGIECDLCEKAGESDVSLKDGGLSLEEAKKLVAIYKGYAGENGLRGNTAIANKYYIKVGCHGNLFLNCPSFVKYFVNRYTTKKWTSGLTGDGKDVYKYLARDLGLETGSKPRPYAVFSDDSYSPGHTGVVLNVDSAKGTMLIGEAGCYSSGTTKQAYDIIGVKELPINKYHLYTYLDPIINLGGQ